MGILALVLSFTKAAMVAVETIQREQTGAPGLKLESGNWFRVLEETGLFFLLASSHSLGAGAGTGSAFLFFHRSDQRKHCRIQSFPAAEGKAPAAMPMRVCGQK